MPGNAHHFSALYSFLLSISKVRNLLPTYQKHPWHLDTVTNNLNMALVLKKVKVYDRVWQAIFCLHWDNIYVGTQAHNIGKRLGDLLEKVIFTWKTEESELTEQKETCVLSDRKRGTW